MAKKLSKDSLERMQECTNAQEVMDILNEEGVELTDEQLEAVVGGISLDRILPILAEFFGGALQDLLPDDFDPMQMLTKFPMGKNY